MRVQIFSEGGGDDAATDGDEGGTRHWSGLRVGVVAFVGGAAVIMRKYSYFHKNRMLLLLRICVTIIIPISGPEFYNTGHSYC